MLFSNTKFYPIGLDISDLSLKLVQLNQAGKKLKVQALSRVNLKEGLIKDGEIKNKEEVIKNIKKLIAETKYGKVTSQRVVACLPEQKTFIKLIKVNKTSNNTSDIIETEIEKHIPFSLDEIYYDWQVIEENDEAELVLIGAALKGIVDSYIEAFSEAGLSVEALEMEPLTLCRALLLEESSRFKGPFVNNYAIIDIGAVITSMVVYSKDTILFTVKIPISGEQISKEISQSLDIDKDQADKVKIICGFDKEKAQGVVHKVLSGTINGLNNKIKDTLEFYDNHFSKRGPITQIYLCGGGANIVGIEKIISDAVSINTKKGDALMHLGGYKEKFSKLLSETYKLLLDFDKKKSSKSSKKKVSITQDSSLTYTTAFGLALRKAFINKK